MKKKAGLSYFDDGGSTWDWSGYDYSDPFYTTNYNDYGYGSSYDTPYYGNNYGYDLGTGYDYSTGDTYSYDPIYSNSSFYDYYQPDYNAADLADNPYYNNQFDPAYYNTENYSPYTGSWDTYGNYVPDYSYIGAVSPYEYYNSWNPGTQSSYWDYFAPAVPTYNPADFYDPASSVYPSTPTPAPTTNPSNKSPYSTTTSGGGGGGTSPTPRTSSAPTANTPTDSNTGSELTYPGGSPFDTGVTRGRQIQMPQFISARAADGGLMEPMGGIGYNEPSQQPKFMSQGGLQNLYVGGQGDGTSDEVPAMLSNGEFVIPADVVSGLGNGSNEAGAKRLDQFLKMVRHDRQSPDGELPEDAKSPLEYIKQAKEA